jgi:4-hydroxy-tetrahydrodipicolinate synthase
MSAPTIAPGVWGVVATPFHGPDLEVDHASVAALAAHYERVGARGLTVLGVFGEAAALTRTERQEVLRTIVDAVDLPLIVGVTTLSTRPAIDEVTDAQAVAGERIAGVMLQLNSGDPATLSRHLQAVADATGAGIVAQNYPVASGVAVGLDAEIAALSDVNALVAIKAEAAPTARRIAALTGRFDVPVFGGLGGIGLLDELAAGSAGAMTGFSYPEALVETVAAHHRDGFRAARSALLPYLPLVNFEQQPGIGLAIRKGCLVARGLIAEGGVRSPSPGLPPALVAQLHAHITAIESDRAATPPR